MRSTLLATVWLVCTIGCDAQLGEQSNALTMFAPSTAAAAGPGMGMGGPSIEHLGFMLFFDRNLSLQGNQACSDCHGGSAGWTGPDATVNLTGGVYEGSAAGRFGNRKPPSSAYAMRAPRLAYAADSGFFGGNFSDGRATGWDLGSPVADQARGPFLNPVEQGLPNAASLLERVCAAHYGHMLSMLWGADVCSDVTLGYSAIARSIAAFESSAQMSPYSSKYDSALSGQAQLDAREQLGKELFNGKAHCSVCHTSSAAASGEPAVFSDFGYDNVGVPKNPLNPFYRMDQVAVEGTPINPAGGAWLDLGLGAFLRQLAKDDKWRSAPFVTPSLLALDAAALSRAAADNAGKHRVPTLRNVDRRPSSGFVKVYMHNGYFSSLRNLVHFYNTRDVLPRCAGELGEAAAIAQGCWPAPEIEQNVDKALIGNLNLTDAEEGALVAFLSTLSDTTGASGPMHGGGMHGMQGGGMHGMRGGGMHGRR